MLRGPLAGSYTLSVSSPGLQTDTWKVELRSGQMLSMPVHLHIGLMGDVIMIDPGSNPDKTIILQSPGALPAVSAPKPMQR